MRGFYFITDATLSRAGNFNDVKNALKAGVGFIQYRNKYPDDKQAFREALRLRRLCKNVIFLVNDRVDIALAVGADGVHLGREDLPLKIARKLLGKKKIIGLTVHNLAQALQAERQGADYLGVAPIFKTGTKKDAGLPCGVGLIKKIKKHCRLPIVAIGGINLSNAEEVIRSGADCLCAISSVIVKQDVKKEIEKFQKFWESG